MMTAENYSWIESLADDSLRISVDLSLYPLDTLFRACYLFTDRCFLFLTREEPSSVVKVHFAPKNSATNFAEVAAEFSNELINQKVRHDVAEQTRAIRELIVAQAFAEGNLTENGGTSADYHTDPRGIAG